MHAGGETAIGRLLGAHARRSPGDAGVAGERLARAICADREMLDESDVTAIADALAAAQIARISAAIETVRARHLSLRAAVVTGLGAFITERAASAGWTSSPWHRRLAMVRRDARQPPRSALLLEVADRIRSRSHLRVLATTPGKPALVVKVGDGLLAHRVAWTQC